MLRSQQLWIFFAVKAVSIIIGNSVSTALLSLIVPLLLLFILPLFSPIPHRLLLLSCSGDEIDIEE